MSTQTGDSRRVAADRCRATIGATDHPQRSETNDDPDLPDLPGAHPHRHGESLRAIVNRLQRDLENEREAAPGRQIRIPSPIRPTRRTF